MILDHLGCPIEGFWTILSPFAPFELYKYLDAFKMGQNRVKNAVSHEWYQAGGSDVLEPFLSPFWPIVNHKKA